MRSLIWRGANQRGLWIQLTHEFSEVKGQLAHHQEQTKKTTGLSGALKGPKKRGRAKKKIRTKNPQTFWLKTAILSQEKRQRSKNSQKKKRVVRTTKTQTKNKKKTKKITFAKRPTTPQRHNTNVRFHFLSFHSIIISLSKNHGHQDQ